ncbi:DUF4330 domain-containing protein [Maledivibacter halophilus]|uniref:DUF4330 domain-containing protein n=1 Tax=Maledivibacter halophilus TaxID=36842 RepID=A0A1T5JHG2_9FIRM|nr:DUF4330 domain-containing protein [Maledivibacter halophilus]SKC50623.1 protein of unknown function [Maledivibacter halophilus]
MIIDSKGKLFGIINVIDLTILLLIIVLIGGGAYKLSSLKDLSIEDQKPIKVVIEFEEGNKGLIDAIKEGDILFDSVRGTEFGKVVDKTITPHREHVIGKDGKVEYKEIPGAFDGEIRLDSMALINEDGYLVATKPLYIGSELRLKSTKYVFDCKVLNIEE